MRKIRLAALFGFAALALTACGQSGPTKHDMQALFEKAITQANNQMAQVTGGFGGEMGAGMMGSLSIPKITVDSIKCTAAENDVFSCAVAATAGGQTSVRTVSVQKVNGTWVQAQ